MQITLLISAVIATLALATTIGDEKAELAVEGCPCAAGRGGAGGNAGLGFVAPKPARQQQHQYKPSRRYRHRKSSCSSSSSSSSSSTSCSSSSSLDCGCVPKPPYPMPPRGCGCPSSSSSSSSSSCSHRFPTTCPNAKSLEIVRALDQQFVDHINQGNTAAALAMTYPDATFHKLDEVVNPIPFGPICEESTGSIAQLVSQFTSTCYSTWLFDYYRCARVKDDRSVAITAVEISYVNRDILAAANDVVRVWKPTYGCNFKLAYWDLSNLVCKPQVVRDVLDQ